MRFADGDRGEQIAMNADEIIGAIRQLPVEEQQKVTDALLQSLEPPREEVDRLWAIEAQRRLEEI